MQPAIADRTRRGMDRVQVLVRDNNVDQALKALKKKMQREGIFREMKLRGHYEKPSEKKAREKAEAIRRARKSCRAADQSDEIPQKLTKETKELKATATSSRRNLLPNPEGSKPIAGGRGVERRYHRCSPFQHRIPSGCQRHSNSITQPYAKQNASTLHRFAPQPLLRKNHSLKTTFEKLKSCVDTFE